jgi:hypothetical protein
VQAGVNFEKYIYSNQYIAYLTETYMETKIVLAIICIALLAGAVGAYEAATYFANLPQENGEGAVTPTPQPTGTNNQNPQPTAKPAGASNNGGGGDSGSSSSGSAAPTNPPEPQPTPVVTVPPHTNVPDHEDPADYIYDSSDVVDITLNYNFIAVNSPTVTVQGKVATINSAGTYRASGTLNNGQLIINTTSKQTVQLILNGATITCSNSAPIFVADAKKTVLILEGTNSLTDGATYIVDSNNEPSAAVFSKSDFSIYGSGSLTVRANYNDGISSKDGLVIKSGTLTVTSVDDGIRGKDYLVIRGGALTVNCGGDALKSDDGDVDKGYVSIEGGTVTVTSGRDGIDATSDTLISGGQYTCTAGGGSSSSPSATLSKKGINSVVSITIDGGTLSINSADDAIHSNGAIVFNGGAYSLQTGDDGVHADTSIVINQGTIDITKCYEGIESATITINDGTIHVTASDDGINGAGGKDSSGGNDFAPGNHQVYFNGGYIVVTAAGDGIDINGGITMTGGYIIVNGPTTSMNGALDYDTSFVMNGGFILAVGSRGMAQQPSSTSSQCSVMLNYASTKSANTLIHLRYSNGTQLFTFRTSKLFQSVVICSPELKMGLSYAFYTGGSATGTIKDGMYQTGTYTLGTLTKSFTISSITTSYSNL